MSKTIVRKPSPKRSEKKSPLGEAAIYFRPLPFGEWEKRVKQKQAAAVLCTENLCDRERSLLAAAQRMLRNNTGDTPIEELVADLLRLVEFEDGDYPTIGDIRAKFECFETSMRDLLRAAKRISRQYPPSHAIWKEIEIETLAPSVQS